MRVCVGVGGWVGGWVCVCVCTRAGVVSVCVCVCARAVSVRACAALDSKTLPAGAAAVPSPGTQVHMCESCVCACRHARVCVYVSVHACAAPDSKFNSQVPSDCERIGIRRSGSSAGQFSQCVTTVTAQMARQVNSQVPPPSHRRGYRCMCVHRVYVRAGTRVCLCVRACVRCA